MPETDPALSTGQASGPAPGTRALLVGLLTSVLAVAFESVAVATAMPRAGHDLGQIGLYAWAFTLFVLGMVLATVVAGRLSDRIGPLVPFVVGQLLFLVGLLVAGSATSMTMLVAGRFVQGLGGGAVNLSLMVVVALAFPQQRRAKVMAAFSFCWVLPAFIGPLAAGWITDHWSWHWVFRAVVPFVIAALLLVLPALRRLPHEPQPASMLRPAPLWAAVASASGIAALQYAGQRMDAVGAVIAAAAVVALVLGVPRLMPPRFWSIGHGLPAVVWTRLTQAGAFFAAEAFLPLMLVEQRRLTLTEAGMALTIGSLGWTLGSWIQSRPWLSFGRERIILIGTVSGALGIAMVMLFAWHPGLTLALPALGWTLSGFGMGLAVASTSLATMSLSDAETLGRNTASLQVGEGLGNSLMSGLAGAAFHLLHGSASAPVTFGSVFLVPSVVAVLAVACAQRIGAISARDR